MRGILKAALALGMCAAAVPAAAQSLITTASASNSSYKGSLTVINDGIFPANGTDYQTGTVHDYNKNTTFTLTFTGGLQNVGYFNVNVDNNDDYTVTLYNDTAGTSISRTILASYGTVGGGTENFTSNSALGTTFTYVSALSFSPFMANRATITSANGDGAFAIGEAQFFTAASTGVPEPASWAMMILGVSAIGYTLRRRARQSQDAFDAKIKRIEAGEIA